MNTLLLAATAALLFLAPFASSAGLRGAMIVLASLALLVRWRELPRGIALAPRGFAFAFAAWLAICVASLAWSMDRAYSLAELRAESMYSTLALVTYFLAASQPDRWRVWCVAAFAGALAVIAADILQHALGLRWARHPMDGGPGPWSTHLVLLAPLLLTLGWPRPWGIARAPAVQWATATLLVCAAWATDNRIVWAAFGVQLAIAVLLRRGGPATEHHRVRHVARMAWAAALILATAFGVSLVERGNRFYDRDAPVSTSIEADLRPAIWSVAWRRFQDAPWLGHGFGREILANDFIPLTPPTNHPQLRHGHNVFVDVALETGLVGLAAFLGVLATLVFSYVRLLRVPAASPFAVLGLAILAGFLVKNLTDDFLHRHNGLVFWALNGALLGLGVRAARRP